MVFIHAAVGENDDICAFFVGAVTFDKQPVKRLFKRGVFIVQQRDGLHPEARLVHITYLHKIHRGKDGVVDLKHGAVFRLFAKQITVRAYIHGGVRHYLFAQRVDRRVCDLRKKLLEIIEERLVLFGKHGKRNVAAH